MNREWNDAKCHTLYLADSDLISQINSNRALLSGDKVNSEQ